MRNPTLNEAQKFLREAIFARRAVPLGRAHPKSSADGCDRRSAFGPLFPKQRGQVISRVVVNSSSGGGVEMDKRSPSVAMTTDASNSGWGATLGSRSASGRGQQWNTGYISITWTGASSSSQGGALLHTFSPLGQCHSNILLEQGRCNKICCSEQTHSGYFEVSESLHNFNPSLPSRIWQIWERMPSQGVRCQRNGSRTPVWWRGFSRN